jgi:2-polyprenyl-3-methyl-5-hydroxy-6-metoxy-1,4-benzoquinol methylase
VSYHAERTRAYFDGFAEREWDRLEATLQGRVKYAIHKRVLERYVHPGMRVLDVGSGPGRFAIDVARLGARVTLVDLSQVQLDLAREKIGEADVAGFIDGFHRLDVLDLSSLDAAAYDVVVCYGGAISYTVARHVDALRELARVVKPGGMVLVSVMSLYGALRLIAPLDAAQVLDDFDEHLDWNAVIAGDDVVYTKPTSNEFHQPLALFTAAGLRAAFDAAGLHTIGMATSNPLFPEYQQLPRINASPQASARFIELETALSEQPGLVDGGGHLLGIATTS